jgi:hypothetical protein
MRVDLAFHAAKDQADQLGWATQVTEEGTRTRVIEVYGNVAPIALVLMVPHQKTMRGTFDRIPVYLSSAWAAGILEQGIGPDTVEGRIADHRWKEGDTTTCLPC